MYMTQKEIKSGLSELVIDAWDSAVINEGDTLAENRIKDGDPMRNASDNAYIYADMFGVSIEDFKKAAAIYGY